MPGNSVGTVWVDVRFNVGDAGRQLQAALAGATVGAGGGTGAAAQFERTWQTSLANVGAGATKLGRTMSIGLTLPLAALGKSAVSSFKEFDQSMTRIAALNAVPIATTEKWSNEVRELGLEYGVAAEEAADALYFITSSGQEGTKAMETLKVATKASAVGLGETKEIADVLTSAMSAYQDQALTAAKAGDILAAAVHYGKGEADELAGALSQVIPIAANLEISFGEVSGAMAAMTLSGTSADQAATQLRGIFNTLQDLPPIGQQALKTYTGLDYAQLRLSLSSEGLIPVLKRIYDGFGTNKEAIAEVFGNIRALTGVYNLFGQNTEQTLKIIEAVTKASGDLNRAWEITAKSRSKQLELAMNRVHDSMIEMGANLAPIVTTVTGALGSVAQAFTSLPGPMQSVALGFGTLAAAAGPAIFVFGQLSTAVSKLSTAFSTAMPTVTGWLDTLRLKRMYSDEAAASATTLTGRMGGLTNIMGTAGVAVGALAAGYALWQRSMQDARVAIDGLAGAIQAAAGGGGEAKIDETIASTREQIKKLEEEASAFNIGRFNPLNIDYFQQSGEAVDRMYAEIKALEERKRIGREMADQMGLDRTKVIDWLSTQSDAGNKVKNTTDGVKRLGDALSKGGDDVQAFKAGVEGSDNALTTLASRAKEAGDAFFGIMDAQKRVTDAQNGLVEAQRKVTDAQDDYHDAQRANIAASRDVIKAQQALTDASNSTRDARLKLADAERELQDALRGPSEQERIDVESAQLGLQEAQKRARGSFADPLDRRRSQLDVRRARLDLQRAQGGHDERIAELRDKVAESQRGVNSAVQAEIDAQQAVVDARDAKAEASQKEADAFANIDIAQQGVRKAEEDLFIATYNLTIQQDALNTAIANGKINGDAFLAFLEQLKGQYPTMERVIGDYATAFGNIWKAAQGKAPEPPKPPPPPPAPTDSHLNYLATKATKAPGVEQKGDWIYIPGVGMRHRAAGGPLSAGQLSSVNERDMPEMWEANGKQYLLPVDAGRVTPLKPATIDVKGGDGVTVGDVYVQGVQDPVQTAYEVRRQLRVKTRGRGRS